MNYVKILPVLAFLAFSLLLPSSVVAGDLAPSGKPVDGAIDIDFPGGPVSALVASVTKSGGLLNIVGEPAELSVQLPPFSVRNADSVAVASALDRLLQTRNYGLQRNNGSSQPVWVIRKNSDMGGPGFFSSFQLAPYLAHQSVDDIVGAIRTGWELDPSHTSDQLRLKFHPPTGVLLVSSSHQMGLHAVESVLRQLRRTPESESAKPAPKTETAAPAPPKK